MKKQILFIIGLTSVILLFFDSCGKEYTVESPSDSAVTITLNKTNISCVLGETEQTIYLDAVVKRGKKQIGNNWDITWSSSNSSVATVDYYGTVRISKSGNATITASAYGKSATCKITVTEPISITLNSSAQSIMLGGNYYLVATVKRGNETIDSNVSWTSSNTSVATVSSNGLVTAKSIGTTTITASSMGRTATCIITVFQPEYVDLGLSVKWATCNVGASSPEEFGYYYAWGEITTKSSYTWENYRFRSSGTSTDDLKFNKYNTDSSRGTVDNRKTLLLGDDAAYVNWGENWRMPTQSEFYELQENCIWIWTTVNGVAGYKVTSNKTGYKDKSIFFPAAGGKWGTNTYGYGEEGWYWSSSLYTNSNNEATTSRAWFLNFDSSFYSSTYIGGRSEGGSIRPVCP